MAVIKLTQEVVNKLKLEEGKKSSEAVDDQRTGLYVKLTATSAVYYLRYKNAQGTTAHQKIGRTDGMSLSDARNRVNKLKLDISVGNDPREQARTKKNAPTFSEFFTQRYMPYVLPRLRSANKYESLFRCHLRDEFGSQRLDQITREKVQLFHTRLREKKGLSPAQSDHCIKALRASLNYACEIEVIEKNPIARIKLFNEPNFMENTMSKDELSRLLNVLHTDKNRMTCMVALFLLSTGARLNEALSAKWSHISIENKSWLIPSSIAKSKKSRSRALNSTALEIINQLGTENDSEFLFINFRTGTRLKSIHTGWKTLREKAGLPHLRIHDLRHQYATFLINNGRTLYEVSQQLLHSSSVVTERYAHISTKTLQAATESASMAIKAAS